MMEKKWTTEWTTTDAKQFVLPVVNYGFYNYGWVSVWYRHMVKKMQGRYVSTGRAHREQFYTNNNKDQSGIVFKESCVNGICLYR